METYELIHAGIVGLAAFGGGMLFLWRMWRRLGDGMTFLEFLRELNRPL